MRVIRKGAADVSEGLGPKSRRTTLSCVNVPFGTPRGLSDSSRRFLLPRRFDIVRP